ncbi:MAG: DEAD/DEAH box helicase, partial [Candidatus Uhrbacteria bacterium]
MKIALEQPIVSFHSYAKRLAKPLARLDIATVGDLLRHFPVRHEDLSVIVAVRDCRVGESAVIHGRILTIANRRTPRRRMLITEAIVEDKTGGIRCTWFRQPYLAHAFPAGTEVAIAGIVTADDHTGIALVSPLVEKQQEVMLHTGRIVPMYPLTAGITQKQLRFLIHSALPACVSFIDGLPADFRRRERLVNLSTAMRVAHFPESLDKLRAAERRLAFDEVVTYFARIRASRREIEEACALRIPFDEVATKALVAALPFRLTDGQRRAAWDVLQDMAGSQSLGAHPHSSPSKMEGEKGVVGPHAFVRPMQRLLNGDVGSGKTIVAAIAAANVARAGHQAAYLAPTEVLAFQQAKALVNLLRPLGVRVALWTRTAQFLDGAVVAKRDCRAAIRTGDATVIVGTHAILSSDVHFHSLVLAIIDEQHRFGVAQRAALRMKADSRQPIAESRMMPHLLSMTATPIPRTLSLTLLGDLTVSVIPERPQQRPPVETEVVTSGLRSKMAAAIRAAIAAGQQVFVVCPKIEVAEEGTAAAIEVAERAERAFP